MSKKSEKKKSASQRAEALGPRIQKLKGRMAKAGEGDSLRKAKKRVKRAQRKKKRLTIEAAGGKTAMAKAAKKEG